MRVHIVEQGEYLASIAAKYNCQRWQTIYFHPENAAFRTKRPNPNVIRPGDRIAIPDKETKDEICPTGQLHRFRLQSDSVLLRVALRDADGKPMAGEPYCLSIGGRQLQGKANGQGMLEEKIPVGVDTGQLRLERSGLEFPLTVGHLDPVEEDDEMFWKGVQARLRNLGYYGGRIDDDKGPKTTEAIRGFQRDVLGRKEPDGDLDPATKAALRREYGC